MPVDAAAKPPAPPPRPPAPPAPAPSTAAKSPAPATGSSPRPTPPPVSGGAQRASASGTTAPGQTTTSNTTRTPEPAQQQQRQTQVADQQKRQTQADDQKRQTQADDQKRQTQADDQKRQAQATDEKKRQVEADQQKRQTQVQQERKGDAQRQQLKSDAREPSSAVRAANGGPTQSTTPESSTPKTTAGLSEAVKSGAGPAVPGSRFAPPPAPGAGPNQATAQPTGAGAAQPPGNAATQPLGNGVAPQPPGGNAAPQPPGNNAAPQPPGNAAPQPGGTPPRAQPQAGLDRLGLTQADFTRAAQQAQPHLENAIKAATSGDTQGALRHLTNAAMAGAPDLAEKAIPNLARGIPGTGAMGVAKSALTDPKLVHQLVSDPALHGALRQFAQGDVGGGLNSLANNKPARDAAIDALAKNPSVMGGMGKLGLNADDLKRAGDGVPHAYDALMSAGRGDYRAAIDSLRKTGPMAQDLATKGIVNAARNLPDGGAKGMAKSLLTNDPFVRQMVSSPQMGKAFDQFLKGNFADGLEGIASDQNLRDRAVDALATNKDFKTGMDKLGLSSADLKAAGKGLPSMVDAGQRLANGDFKGGFQSLQQAAGEAAPIAQKAIMGAAQNLPDKGAGGMAKSLLTNPEFVKQLTDNKDLHSAIGQLGEGRFAEGLKGIAGNKQARDAAVDALAQNKDFKAGMDKLGLDNNDLKAAGEGLPSIVDAGQKLSQGDFKGAFQSLKDAAGKASPVVQKGIIAAAKNLPDTGAGGMAKSLLTDPAFVKQLTDNKELHDAIGQLGEGKFAEGLKGIAGNKGARDAAIDALAKNKDFKAGMDKLGLNANDLKASGEALPSMVDAGQKLAQGDFKGAFQSLKDAAGKASPIVQKGIIAAAKNLPDTGAGGMAKSLLTDPAFVKQLTDNKELHDAIGQLGDGKFAEGLKGIASNKQARDAAVDALAKNKDFKAGMDKLGLNADDLKASGEGLPSIVDAGQKLAQGDFKGAFQSLKDAAGKASPIVQKGIIAAAKNLPDTGAGGMAKSLLTDPAFVKQLTDNKDLHDAIGQLGDGKFAEGLKGIAGNKGARDAAIDALAKNKDFKSGMDKLGLNADDLKASGEGLPSIVDAGQKLAQGDFKGAFQSLKDAAGKASPIVQKGIIAAAKNLPDTGAGGMAKSLLTDPAFVKQLTDNKELHDAIGQLGDGKFADGLKGIAGNKGARDAAIDALAKNKDFKAGMDKLGLNADDLKASGEGLPSIVDAGQKLAQGDFKGALQSLKDAAGKASPVVQKGIMAAAKNLPDTGAGGIAKSVLTDPAAVKALVEDKDLHASFDKLINGDLSALKDIAKNPGAGAIANAALNSPAVKDTLAKIGLTPEDVKGSLGSVADLAKATEALAQKDWQGALNGLRDAAKDMPPALAQKAIAGAASKLPDQGASGMVKSLLTDPNLVKQFLENKDVKGSVEKLFNGNFEEGLKGLLGNEQLRNATAEALAKNQDFMKKLEPFGIKNGKDLAGVANSVTDLMKAGEFAGKGELGNAFNQLSSAFKNLPADTRAKMINAMAEKLHLPSWAKDTLTAVGGALGDPKLARSMGDAINSFKNGDAAGFGKNLAEAGRQLARDNPTAATAMLNSLSHLPGSLGRLFKDPNLNKAFVESGSAESIFNATEKLIGGDPGGAMTELGNAVGGLIGQGPHYSVFGQELPFGEQGLKNMTNMFERFVDAMPDGVKRKIEEGAAKIAAKTIGKSIPFVSIFVGGYSAIGSAQDLWNSMSQPNKDWLQVSIDAAQLGLDVSSMVPGLGSFTGPLSGVVGTVKFVKGATDLISNVQEFQKGLLGFK